MNMIRDSVRGFLITTSIIGIFYIINSLSPTNMNILDYAIGSFVGFLAALVNFAIDEDKKE